MRIQNKEGLYAILSLNSIQYAFFWKCQKINRESFGRWDGILISLLEEKKAIIYLSIIISIHIIKEFKNLN